MDEANASACADQIRAKTLGLFLEQCMSESVCFHHIPSLKESDLLRSAYQHVSGRSVAKVEADKRLSNGSCCERGS
jgi:hypothetical protein